jgi:hypothetical protein
VRSARFWSAPVRRRFSGADQDRSAANKAPQDLQDRRTPKKDLSTCAPGFLSFFRIFFLQFLKTLLQKGQTVLLSSSSQLNFKPVPLGRFYSSRPSSRSRTQIVPE